MCRASSRRTRERARCSSTRWLPSLTRNATIRCATPLSVFSLPSRELELLSQGMPELRRNLEQLRDRRLRPAAGV